MKGEFFQPAVNKNYQKIDKFTYSSKDKALEVYTNFSTATKEQMASVYQNAFGGEPWYERFVCLTCDKYSKSADCISCKSSDLPEAYPSEELVNTEFPNMLQTFIPGTLLLSYGGDCQVNGFSTGGFITLGDLINKKYAGNTTILSSIEQKYGINSETEVFYDNETCVDPARQKRGLGRIFSRERINAAKSIRAENICGRTINLPWLNVKKQQLTDEGYAFFSFVPEGDTYEVGGSPRVFYLARKDVKE